MMLSATELNETDYKDFAYQAAGHQYIDGFRTLLKCNDGTLLKIFQDCNRGHHEVEFYKNIFSTKQDPSQVPDQVTCVLRQFIPKYFGTVTMKNDKECQLYMKISDVTNKFKKPCVIDLKIGRRTYDHLATEAKRIRAISKYPLQDQIGFRIDGMKVYNNITEDFDIYDKMFGRKLDQVTILHGLSQFFPNDKEWKIRIIEKTILKLEALIQWFNDQSRWIFSSSSLLIVYDGDPNSNNEIELKMIDFTHVYESKIVHKSIEDSDTNFKDENTIYGLNSLLNILKQLRLDLVDNNS